MCRGKGRGNDMRSKKMKLIVLVIAEIIGLALISAEFGILLNNADSPAHIFGYLGASIMLGAFLFWKFMGSKD